MKLILEFWRRNDNKGFSFPVHRAIVDLVIVANRSVHITALFAVIASIAWIIIAVRCLLAFFSWCVVIL
jgi:hypothetical protein